MARFSANATSDYDVRRSLHAPSIDCVVRRARLKYLSRLAAESLPQLNLALQTVDRHGNRLPWVKLVVNDLRILKAHLPSKLASLPDPLDDSHSW